MILYVNGDSHTAGAEAAVNVTFAEDAGLPELGRAPHPENLAASWGQQLANMTGWDFVCDAEGAASNYRILRTTQAWLDQLPPWEQATVIIQWSTWEREEWFYQDTYLQVNSSGLDMVPPELAQRYKHYIANVDWTQCQQFWHEKIWQLHSRLVDMKIPHFFFNGNNHFNRITKPMKWGDAYLDPYGKLTYDHCLRQNGFEPASPGSWHFGKQAHRFWAEFVLQYCIQTSIIDANEIPID